MKINHIIGSKYTIINHNGKHRLVKVVSEYDNEKQAYDDMFQILMGSTTEEEIEKKWKDRKGDLHHG